MMIKNMPSVAKVLAHEDIQEGDFVSVVGTTYQLPSFLWCGLDATMSPPEQPIRMEFWESNPSPVRVKGICLPFLFVMNVDRDYFQIDVRRSRLVRVDEIYAKNVWQTLRRAKARKEKK